MPKVLLIEDEAPLLRLIGWMLVEHSFEVTAVTNGADGALELGDHTRPDIVIFNLHLSIDMKRRYLNMLHTLDPRPKIIELDGADTPASEWMVDAVLTKPFHMDDLLAEIERLMGQPQLEV